MKINEKAAGAATPTAREVETVKLATVVKIIALIFLVVTMASFCRPRTHCFEVHYFVVEQGQTLWDIGAKAKDMGDPRDIREIIHYIVQDNNLGEFVYPGQELKVYVEVKR